MTKEQQYLNDLFETARNEPPEVHVEKIMGAIDNHIITGATLTSLSKYSFLTSKNGLIGFVSIGIVTSVVVVMSLSNKNNLTVKEELGSTITNSIEEGNDFVLPHILVDTTENTNTDTPAVIVTETEKNIPKKQIKEENKRKENKQEGNIEINDPILASVDTILEEENIIEERGRETMLDDGIASISMTDVIVIKEKRIPKIKTRYLITENTTEEDLIEMTTQLKELNAKMIYYDLKFENNKLIHFQVKVKKDNDYIQAHHNFAAGASYVYEFGCEMSEAGLFIGLFGTLYEGKGNNNAIPCNALNHNLNSKKEKRKNKKRNRKKRKN